MTTNNRANAVIAFNSNDFARYPPHKSYTESCSATINIGDIDVYGGGVAGSILNTFEGLMRNFVEDQVEGVACTELGDLGTTLLQDALSFADTFLEPYLAPLTGPRADPLHPEKSMVVPSDMRLMNFRTTDDSIGAWFNSLLTSVDDLLGARVVDPNSPNGSGKDLGVNKIMRDSILEPDRSFTMDIEKLGFNNVIFEGHDMMSKTVIRLDSVKAYGLDTLKTFDPLVAIGSHTLQSHLLWDTLSLDIALTLEITASSTDDAVIVDANPKTVIEQIVIKVAVDELDVMLSVLLAINQDKLGDLGLGSLLDTTTILPCLLNCLHKVEIAGLSVNVKDIINPELIGFISVGLDRIISTAVNALFGMYEPVVKKALPNIFQLLVTDWVNTFLDDFMSDPSNKECPYSSGANSDAFIDLRDMMAPPNKAFAAGGSGTAQYGDVVYSLVGILRKQLISVDSEDGSPTINSILVDPMTKAQSGVEGTVKFSSELIYFVKEVTDNIWSSVVENFEFGLSDVLVENIDTFSFPMALMELTKDPYNLHNYAYMGKNSPQPLTGTVRMMIGLDGDSPLSMQNKMDVSVKMPTGQVVAKLFAKISETRFLDFPLKNLMNLSCWLATLPAPEMDQTGRRVDDSANAGVALEQFLMAFTGMSIDFQCVTCSSQGIWKVSNVLMTLQTAGMTEDFFARLTNFAVDFIQGDWVQSFVDQSLADAPKSCPHYDVYEEDFVSPYGLPEFPALSRDDIEFFLFSGLMATEVLAVVAAESHVSFNTEDSDPLSKQSSFNLPQDKPIVDFTSIPPLIDLILGALKKLVSKEVKDASGLKDRDIGLNSLLRRTGLLNDDRSLVIPFDDMALKFLETEVFLKEVRIQGLDTFTSINVVDIIGPQTILNEVALERLQIEADILIQDSTAPENDEVMTVSFGLENIQLTLGLFLAVDETLMKELELQFLLDIGHILPCIMSIFHAIEMTEFSMTVGNIVRPTISGFVSSEVSNSISKLTDTIFDNYGPVMLESIPILTDVTIKGVFNNMIEAYIKEGFVCPESETPPGQFFDFRDFFLSPTEAKEIGALGTSPYGPIGDMLKSLLDQELLSLDSNGIPVINDRVIEPLTEDQSGIKGDLNFETNLNLVDASDLNFAGIEKIVAQISNLKFENLNTFGTPLLLLDPVPLNGHLLDNGITIGAGNEPMRTSVGLVFEIEGDSMFAMRNQMDIRLDLNTASVLGVILAKISVDGFMNFPLGDILTPECLLSLFPYPKLDEEGLRLQGVSPSLAIEQLAIDIASWGFNVACTSCSTAGMNDLPEIFNTLKEAGATDALKTRMMPLVTDFLESDYMQTSIDRMLETSAKSCQNHDEYDEQFSPSYPMPGLPSLSLNSAETLIFVALALVETAAVVVAQSHLSAEVSESDPLAAQTALSETSGDIQLVDLTDFGPTIGEFVNQALESVTTYMSGMQNDSEGPNADTTGKDLGINLAMRSLLLDENRVFSMTFDDIGVELDGIATSLNAIRIIGLDTFKDFKALDIVAPQTVQNYFELDELTIEIEIMLAADRTIASRMLLGSSSEHVTISFGLEGVSAAVDLLMAIDIDKLGNLELGSIMQMENILKCLLTSAHAIELSQLTVKTSSITKPKIVGLSSDSLHATISKMTDAIFDKYGSAMIESMPNLTNGTLRSLLNALMTGYRNDNSSCPKMSPLPDSPGFIDFRDFFLTKENAITAGGLGLEQYGNLFPTLWTLIENEVLALDDNDGTSKINDMLIRPLTESQSDEAGTISFPGDLFSTATRLSIGGLKANIELGVSNLRIENIDSVGHPLTLLKPNPDQPYSLENIASMGVSSDPLRILVRILFSVQDGGNMQMRNELDISLDLYTAQVLLGMMLQVSEKPLMEFPMRDMMNLDCWLAKIPNPPLDERGIRLPGYDPTAALEALAISVARMGMNITCIDCTSPDLYEISSLLASPAAIEDATETANMVLDYLSELLGGRFVGVQIDRMLNDAAARCPHSPTFDTTFVASKYSEFDQVEGTEDPVKALIALAGAAIGAILLVAFVIIIVKWIARRRHTRWLKSLPSDQLALILLAQRQDDDKQKVLDHETEAMFRSQDIPWIMRYMMPLTIIGNIAFFLSGHLSLAASVFIVAELAGETIEVAEFYEFSMTKSIFQMWEADAKELAIIIVIFAVIWPYTKQLTTLTVWFLPPSVLSSSRRGNILLWLDSLGKWSMIDIFILLISMASFRVTIDSPDRAFLPPDFYSIDLMVVPMWGLYANLIAQLVSQISSHFIIHYHRKIISVAEADYEANLRGEAGDNITDQGSDVVSDVEMIGDIYMIGQETPERKTALHEHAFQLEYLGEGLALKTRPWVNKFLVCTGIILAILVIIGCVLPSFSLEVLGIVGVLVESGQKFEEAVKPRTVFNMAGMLIEQAKFLGTTADLLGLGSLATILIFSVFLCPLLSIFALLRQWFVSMTKAGHEKNLVAIEILQAWQYMEVYVISIIVGSWQLGPISEVMINEYCGSLNGFFAEMTYYGLLDAEDAQCFRIRGQLEEASYILVITSFILAFMISFVTKAVVQQRKDQEYKPQAARLKSLDSNYVEDTVPTADQIHPTEVHFTDTFRCFLISVEYPSIDVGSTFIEEPGIDMGISFENHSNGTMSTNSA
jgi:hypothetical protein